jgi:hypothetical protein
VENRGNTFENQIEEGIPAPFMIKNALMSVLILALVTGCVIFRKDKGSLTDKQLSSVKIQDLKQFEGIYLDKPQGNGPRLSHIIFHKFIPSFYMPSIDSVSCMVLETNQIHIQALSNKQVVIEKTLVLGKDFNLSSSKIPTGSKTISRGRNKEGTSGFAPDLVTAAVIHTDGEIFLNKDGDLIFHSSTHSAGLVLFVIPVAGSLNTHSVYKKLK